VAYEIGLAILSDLLSRAINLCDSLLGDKFTSQVSLRLMVPVGMGQQTLTLLSLSAAVIPTPERRKLDYLRMLGAGSQSAKEVKIFGLGRYLTDRSRVLFDRTPQPAAGRGDIMALTY